MKADAMPANSCGIYTIVNIANGRMYIGSTSNFKKRFIAHRQSLKRGDHSNQGLQADFHMFGHESFHFVPIEECRAGELLERERSYQKSAGDVFGGACYNVGFGPGRPIGSTHVPPEHRQKRRVVTMNADLWEWCAGQPGGASAYIRELIDADRREA